MLSEKQKSRNEKLKNLILKKKRKGKVVLMTVEGLKEANLDEFIEQPTEGLLYDLNRDRLTVLCNLGNDIKWVNDFAVGLVIERLKEQIAPKKVVDTFMLMPKIRAGCTKMLKAYGETLV